MHVVGVSDQVIAFSMSTCQILNFESLNFTYIYKNALAASSYNYFVFENLKVKSRTK